MRKQVLRHLPIASAYMMGFPVSNDFKAKAAVERRGVKDIVQNRVEISSRATALFSAS